MNNITRSHAHQFQFLVLLSAFLVNMGPLTPSAHAGQSASHALTQHEDLDEEGEFLDWELIGSPEPIQQVDIEIKSGLDLITAVLVEPGDIRTLKFDPSKSASQVIAANLGDKEQAEQTLVYTLYDPETKIGSLALVKIEYGAEGDSAIQMAETLRLMIESMQGRGSFIGTIRASMIPSQFFVRFGSNSTESNNFVRRLPPSFTKDLIAQLSAVGNIAFARSHLSSECGLRLNDGAILQ